MLVVYISVTQARVTWEEKPSIEESPSSSGLWEFGGAFSWLMIEVRVYHDPAGGGRCILRQAVLSDSRSQEKQARKPHSPCSLLQFLTPGLGLEFLFWLLSMMGPCA